MKEWETLRSNPRTLLTKSNPRSAYRPNVVNGKSDSKKHWEF